MDGRPFGSITKHAARRQLVDEGQAPHTAIIGCADSRAPLEMIFDAMPGQRLGQGFSRNRTMERFYALYATGFEVSLYMGMMGF